MLRKMKIAGFMCTALLFTSFQTNSAPIWGPWSYHHADLTFTVQTGIVTRCWYVRYKISDPTYRDAYKSFITGRYSAECPATPPF